MYAIVPHVIVKKGLVPSDLYHLEQTIEVQPGRVTPPRIIAPDTSDAGYTVGAHRHEVNFE